MGVACRFFVACTLTGCGGAAPTTSSSPIAVEMPSITDVPYVTSVVASSSGSLSVPGKSGVWKQIAKAIGMTGNPFTPPSSFVACKTTNRFRYAWKGMSDSDLVVCGIKESIAPAATSAGINLYDGNYHDVTLAGGVAPMNLRMKVQRGGATVMLAVWRHSVAGPGSRQTM